MLKLISLKNLCCVFFLLGAFSTQALAEQGSTHDKQQATEVLDA